MSFTHYVKFSDMPMARVSCNCSRTKSHYAGEGTGELPHIFYSALRRGLELSWEPTQNELPSPSTTERTLRLLAS